MNLTNRIEAFTELGNRLSQFLQNKDFLPEIKKAINQATASNPWFTLRFQMLAIENITHWLTLKELKSWTNRYCYPNKTANIAVIMAGNIPLVGFHDFLSTLICGHNIYVKLSGKDKFLLPAVAKELMAIDPRFKSKIFFLPEILNSADAIIATGSNNTARYFEYYFKNKPQIIRKNRSSIAILTGKESTTQLTNLAADICLYYGLGCRNVSKVFVPDLQILERLKDPLKTYGWMLNNHLYTNNLTYHKARLKTQNYDFIDANSVILTKNKAIHSPVAIVNYEVYHNIKPIQEQIKLEAENLQCIVGDLGNNYLPFGKTQQPALQDYADNIDTVKFLTELVV